MRKSHAPAPAVAAPSPSRTSAASHAQDLVQDSLLGAEQPWSAWGPTSDLPPDNVGFDFSRLPLFSSTGPGSEGLAVSPSPVWVQRRCSTCGGEQERLRIQRRCAKCDAEEAAPQRKADPASAESVQVGAPNDAYEQEADRVADAVVATQAGQAPQAVAGRPGAAEVLSLIRGGASGGAAASSRSGASAAAVSAAVSPAAPSSAPVRPVQTARALVQREGGEEGEVAEEAGGGGGLELSPPEPGAAAGGDAGGGGGGDADDEGPELQCQTAGGERPSVRGSALGRQLRESRGDGRPLSASTRDFMESRFGFDFGAVRIHSDVRASSMNEALGAFAFTSGHDVYFAPGQYRPGTRDGDRLLAHELTHVVQQSGGAAAGPMPAVQRSTHYERKPYTGNQVHQQVEQRLRAADTGLVTEAPIPGATRNTVAHNVIGSADLYKSPNGHVPDIRGEYRQDRQGALTFFPLTAERRGRTDGATLWSPSARANRGAPSTILHGSDFPSSFEVADLKPLATGLLGSGMLQIDNYQRGMGLFAREVNTASATHNDGAPTTRVPSGAPLNHISIPHELDYNHFDPLNPAQPTGGLVIGGRRIWLFNFGTNPAPRLPGLVVYFDLDPQAPAAAKVSEYEGLLAGLQGIRQFVRQPQTPIGNNAGLAQTKRRPGISRLPSQGLRPKVRAAQRHRIQRTTDWRALGRQFEQRRGPWARRVRSFMRGERRGMARRLQVDAALGIRRPNRRGQPGDQTSDFKGLRFWSSAVGRFVGRIRFMMGSTFDALAQRFQRLRQRFQGWSARARGLSGSTIGVGWQRTLIRVLMRAVQLGITRFLSESFRIFVDCINGLVSKALRVITDDASEEVQTHICELKRNVEELERRFQEEFEAKFGSYDRIIETVADVQQWLGIAGSLITLLRLGFQAVACLSPPALGCLWGLVGQVALEAVLDLIVGTRWFEENIVRHASVRAVILRFVGPTYQGFIRQVLARAGLTEFATDVNACQLEVAQEASLGPAGGLEGSGLAAHRSAWERRNMPALLAALGPLFRGSGGRPATEAELRRLMEAVRRGGKTPEELRQQVEAMRGGGNAPVDVEALARTLEGPQPQVPPGPPQSQVAPGPQTPGAGGGTTPPVQPPPQGQGPGAQVVDAVAAPQQDRTATGTLTTQFLNLDPNVRASPTQSVRVTVQLEHHGVTYLARNVEIFIVQVIPASRATGGRRRIRYYYANDWTFEGANTVILGGADRVYTRSL